MLLESVRRMAQGPRIDFQQLRRACLKQFSLNLDRFRNEFAQRVASEGTSIQADQQELFTPIGRNKDRRNPSAHTARRAVTVNFPLTGIHHAQIALTVDDFARDRHHSQIMNCL